MLILVTLMEDIPSGTLLTQSSKVTQQQQFERGSSAMSQDGTYSFTNGKVRRTACSQKKDQCASNSMFYAQPSLDLYRYLPWVGAGVFGSPRLTPWLRSEETEG